MLLEKRLKAIIYRILFGANILINLKREPFISFSIFKNYIIKGKIYPLMDYIDFRNFISITRKGKFKFVRYQNEEYAYPSYFSDSLCIENLNAVLNEQTNPKSPHKYLCNGEIGRDWIIYDIGCGEGYQAKQWAKKAKKIIIFEPVKKHYECLNKTFEKEIRDNKVQIFNIGLSNKKKINYNKDKLNLIDLFSLVRKYSLPYPTYIKVDIEGEEINFLKGAEKILKSPNIKRIDICTYHKPNDYIAIPKLLSTYKGSGYFNKGVITFNRNAILAGSYSKLYQPAFRKCLYVYIFEKETNSSIKNNPFFSICIETYNRGRTIYLALESIQKQTFRNFEVIIVDNKSKDNTIKEIKRFFSSELYKKNPFKYIFRLNKEHLDGVKNWNEPLKLARGKYVAVLEGDNQFLPSHLKEAYYILNKYSNIGIYAVGSQDRKRLKIGLIDSKNYFQQIYQLKDISPPSETIFIRKYKKVHFYNVNNYIYCPEFELYLRISNDGLRAYCNDKQNVIVLPSSVRTNYTYFIDKFKIIKKYRNHKWVNNMLYFKVLISQTVYAFKRYIYLVINKNKLKISK